LKKLNIDRKYKILQEMNYPLYQLITEAESVNSDDEDPNVDQPDSSSQQPEQVDPNADQQEQVDPAQQEQENFLQELNGTQDKFLQFILYDKLLELSNKIETIKENFQIKDSDYDSEFNTRLEQYGQYIEVLNELIFSISTATVYNIVGQVELELIQLLKNYLKFHNKDNKWQHNM